MNKISSQDAVEILKNSGIVIFPTDTAFGIGCRADDELAVKRLFEIRRRPENKPTPVLVSGIEMAEEFTDEVPEAVQNLMEKHWPGGLTVILNCHDTRIAHMVKGGTDTLGVRMPNHEIPLELVRALNVPILAPSANFAGDNTPYSFDELDPELVQLVDGVIEGECTVKQASTVIDCTETQFKTVRHGAVELGL